MLKKPIGKPAKKKAGLNPNQKFGNKPFWYSTVTGQTYDRKTDETCEYFNSILEFKIWLGLLNYLPKHKIHRQFPVCIKPATGEYGAAYWKVDFAVGNVNSIADTVLIEAKGEWIMHDSNALAEFRHKVAFLEYAFHDNWLNLHIASDKPFDLNCGIQVVDVPTLMSVVRSRLA